MKLVSLIVSLFCIQMIYGQQNVFDVARKGTVEEMKIIMTQNSESINSLNEEGYSPLILACYKGNLDVAKYLIQNVKDINGNSTMGTPLMAAVVKKNVEIVKLLLDNKADPNIADANGTTALMYATMFKSYELTKMLIKAKANPESKDNRNKSAIDYAILANDDQLIEILKFK